MSLRNFILGFMSPAKRTAVEAESRQWRGACPHCGAVHSVWDLGGIRAGAAGRPTRVVRCPDCRKSGARTFARSG